MTLRDLLIRTILKFVWAAVFIFFTAENVTSVGWGFFSVLGVVFATNNTVQGLRMLKTYFEIKKTIDK